MIALQGARAVAFVVATGFSSEDGRDVGGLHATLGPVVDGFAELSVALPAHMRAVPAASELTEGVTEDWLMAQL